MTHSNSDLLNQKDASEGWHFRQALDMANKVNWRKHSHKTVFADAKNKAEWLKEKAIADRNFGNKTAAHILT